MNLISTPTPTPSNKEMEEQENQKRLKRLQQEAFDALFTKLCTALRKENLNEITDLYQMTLEQWKKEEDEKKRLQEQSTFSANEKKIKASMELASQKMSSFWKNAKASLKTLEDPNFRTNTSSSSVSTSFTNASTTNKKTPPQPSLQQSDEDTIQSDQNENPVSSPLFSEGEEGDSTIKEQSKDVLKESILQTQLNPYHCFSLFNMKKSFFFTNTTSNENESTTTPTNQKYQNITTPLHEVCRIGICMETLKEIFDLNALNINEKNGKYRTLLHMSAGGLTSLELKCIEAKKTTTTVGDTIDDTNVIGISLSDGEDISNNSTSQKIKHGFLSLYHTLSKKNIQSPEEEEDDKKQIPTPEEYKQLDQLSKSRLNMVVFLLQNDISINSVDYRNRTALHYAAELGRKEICAKLISLDGILLTIIDVDGKTAAEVASDAGHDELSALLEAYCVWKEDDCEENRNLLLIEQEEQDTSTSSSLAHPFDWFRTINFEKVDEIRNNRIAAIRSWAQEKVDGVSNLKSDEDDTKCNVYVLSDNEISKVLYHYYWNTTKTIENLEKEFNVILKEAGINTEENESPTQEESMEEDMVDCLICCEEYSQKSKEWIILPCKHGFCQSCLLSYLDQCYQDRLFGIQSISCPHHLCKLFLSSDVIRDLTTTNEDLYDKLVKVENELMISSCCDLRFCPEGGCEGIVQLVLPATLSQNFGVDCLNYADAVCCFIQENNEECVTTYEGVTDPAFTNVEYKRQPYKPHRFCFSCSKTPHWPIACTTLETWLQKIKIEIGTASSNDETKTASFEDLAQDLWIKANTRPCPKCSVPIEKNDGCNHMTCSNRFCRYEFCWICRKEWKLHSSSTGGYFRCNRWQEDEEEHESYDDKTIPAQDNEQEVVSKRPDQTYGTSIHSAKLQRKKSKAMARFLHHYSRWIAQEQSLELELKMSNTVLERLLPVITVHSNDECLKTINRNDISFLYSAFTELLECRSFLKHCYVFAFYRYARCTNTKNTSIFYYSSNSKLESEKLSYETLLSELELLTEQMSDIVARTHLRATQYQIMFLTKGTADKRRQLSNFVMSVNQTMKEENEIKRKKRLEKKKKSESSDEAWDSEESEEVHHNTMDEFWNHVRQHGDVRTITDAQELAMLLDRSNLFTNANTRYVLTNNSDDSDDENTQQVDEAFHTSMNRMRSRHSARRRRHHHRHYPRRHYVPTRGQESPPPNRVIFSRSNEEDNQDNNINFFRAYHSMANPNTTNEDINDQQQEQQQETTNEGEDAVEQTNNNDTIINDEQEDIRRAIEESIRMQMSLQEEEDENVDEEDEQNPWDCGCCTYRNRSAGRLHCAMCGTRR